MNEKLKCLACLVLLLGLSGTARATDYYVSPSGNDANSGTSPGEAWQTISKVNSTTFSPGDSILFEGGEMFSGSLSFSSTDSGTVASPVTVGSYGTGRATIDSGTDDGLYAVNCEGFIIQDLVFVGSGYLANQADGISLECKAPSSDLEYVRIQNVDVSGYRRSGIKISGGGNGFRDLHITDSEVHDGGDKGIDVMGPWPPRDGYAHSDIYIADCKAYNIFGDPDKSSHSGNGILLYSVDGATVEYCEAYNNGELCPTTGGPVAIWSWGSNSVTIQFCEAHHNNAIKKDGGGFDIDGAGTNCILQYNYSHDNVGSGYLICQWDGAEAYYDNTVRYNITENDGLDNGHGSIHFWSSGTSGGIQDTQVYNNTVYVSAGTEGGGIEIDSGGIFNTEIYNNIIYTVAGKQVIYADNTGGGWYFKGNCYWSSGAPLQIDWGGTTYTSLAAWRSATGQETHDGNDVGFELDPQLIDAGNGWTIGDPHRLATLTAYKLSSSSALINAGLDIQTEFGIDPGPHDYYGSPIPIGGQYDVGAQEYRRPADFNFDTNVNFIDYAPLTGALMTQAGEDGFEDMYDLRADDKIDMADVGVFAEQWLWAMEP